MRRAAVSSVALAFLLPGCPQNDSSPPPQPDATVSDAAPVEAAVDAPAPGFPPGPLDGAVGFDAEGVDASVVHPCDLPGSIQFTAGGVVVVPGDAGSGGFDLSYLQVPTGFCVHWFAQVPDVRQLRFAPGGELFAASPTTPTTGGGPNGEAAIVVLPDDNRDGVADSKITFLPTLPSTQGLMFAGGYLYYQDATKIMRVPYAIGDRAPRAPSEEVADIDQFTSIIHWPKTIDISDDGTVYVTNGADQDDMCDPARPFHGGILKLDGTANGTVVSKGYRNPIAIRCARGHNQCFAVELAKDYTYGMGGREKVVPVRQGDDFGYPCCAAQGVPYAGITPAPDCSAVTPESVSFYISHTPFGIDFEPGLWPAPWTGNAIVSLHGQAGSWAGARVVAVKMDPATGLLMPGTDLDGGDTGAMTDFATGWDNHTLSHGRPAPVAFSKDGRLFLGNDVDGTIVWIAPLAL